MSENNLAIYYGTFPKAWNFLRAASTPDKTSQSKERAAQAVIRDVGVATVLAHLDLHAEVRREAFVSLISHVETTQSVTGVESIFLALLYYLRNDADRALILGGKALWAKVASQNTATVNLIFYNFETRTWTTMKSDMKRTLCQGAVLDDLDKLTSRIVPFVRVENPFKFMSPIHPAPAPIPPPQDPVIGSPAPVPAPVTSSPATATNPVSPTVQIAQPPHQSSSSKGREHKEGLRTTWRDNLVNHQVIHRPSEKELEENNRKLEAQEKELRKNQSLFIGKAANIAAGIVGTFSAMLGAGSLLASAAVAGTVTPLLVVAVSLTIGVAVGAGALTIYYAVDEMEIASMELSTVTVKQETVPQLVAPIYIQNHGTVIINQVNGQQVIITNGNSTGAPAPAPPVSGTNSGGGPSLDPDNQGSRPSEADFGHPLMPPWPADGGDRGTEDGGNKEGSNNEVNKENENNKREDPPEDPEPGQPDGENVDMSFEMRAPRPGGGNDRNIENEKLEAPEDDDDK